MSPSAKGVKTVLELFEFDEECVLGVVPVVEVLLEHPVITNVVINNKENRILFLNGTPPIKFKFLYITVR